jgi:hypothetical protein
VGSARCTLLLVLQVVTQQREAAGARGGAVAAWARSSEGEPPLEPIEAAGLVHGAAADSRGARRRVCFNLGEKGVDSIES